MIATRGASLILEPYFWISLGAVMLLWCFVGLICELVKMCNPNDTTK